jgi:hypothetical protein
MGIFASIKGSSTSTVTTNDTMDSEANYSTSWLTTAPEGPLITTKTACKLVSVTKTALCAATRCRLFDNAHSVLATQTYSSNVATFNYDLANATNYFILGDDNGSSIQLKADSTSSNNIDKTNFTYVDTYRGDTWAVVSNKFVGPCLTVTTSVTTTTTVLDTKPVPLGYIGLGAVFIA